MSAQGTLAHCKTSASAPKLAEAKSVAAPGRCGINAGAECVFLPLFDCCNRCNMHRARVLLLAVEKKRRGGGGTTHTPLRPQLLRWGERDARKAPLARAAAVDTHRSLVWVPR